MLLKPIHSVHSLTLLNMHYGGISNSTVIMDYNRFGWEN